MGISRLNAINLLYVMPPNAYNCSFFDAALEICTDRFFRPEAGQFEKKYLSFAGPAQPVGKITFYLLARPVEKIAGRVRVSR